MPGLRLVLYGYPPATIDFMADLVTKWLDDAIIAQPVDELHLICDLLGRGGFLWCEMKRLTIAKRNEGSHWLAKKRNLARNLGY